MIIKNFKEIATSKTRIDALKIINEGIESVLTGRHMKSEIIVKNNILSIQKNKWNLSKYKNIFVVGAGKAAVDMAKSIENILGKRITKGIVIDTREEKLKTIKVVKGTHPLTSSVNLEATKEIIDLLENSNENDLVICLISGGGSALMDYPRVDLQTQIKVNKQLLASGANITEINTVRKHLSYVKGGQLAAIAHKSTIITLIVSDVISNDLAVIASGPTVLDKTSKKDAEKIAKKYNLPSLPFIETPKNKLDNVTNILLITNISASNAMSRKAKELGYRPKILTTQLKGEASVIGKKLALMAKKGTALIAAGETTVSVKGKGKGGRNQELALSASNYIKEGTLVSSSSDGVDFITDASGGIVDENTKIKANKLGLNFKLYLEDNDSYNFLKEVNGLIVMDKTGTNVGDLILVLGNK